ncbi:dipeptidase [Olivibacter ginsenosidimutans]|uniref:Dipeptidase n=2 Tax=Olivibacter ginsenosidimutans TaxID=1176537 RepID=A0ABP9C2P9_9SPHI
MVSAQEALELHRQAVVIDLHNDVLSESVMRGKNIAKSIRGGRTDLPRLKSGGVDVQFFSVWCDGKKKHPFAYANQEIDALYQLIKENSDKMLLATTVEEIKRGIAEHKLVAMIGVEGGHMLADNLANIDSLYRRGVRYVTLTWNNSTHWASSAADESRHKIKQKGLSDFGRQVIQRMNQLGMIVDLSHVGEQTFYDVLKICKKPVLVSHSDAYGLNPHYRNLKDQQIKAVAQNGGVIGVNFYSDFLDPNYRKKIASLYAQYVSKADTIPLSVDKKFDKLPAQAKQALRPPLALVIDHIDYLVKMAGIDHVGIGADFDGMESTPIGLDDVQDYPKLTEALLNRGYAPKDIRKILGENVLRVIQAQEN